MGDEVAAQVAAALVSMESGLEDRNNLYLPTHATDADMSQWSPA